MAQITKTTLQFLSDIKRNNNREWFDKNKFRYLEAQKELKAFGEEWMRAVMSFDASLRDELKPYLFRIYRDARFAKGRPYKNNLGLLLVKGGRPSMHQRAGYYLHFEPGACFLAGGAYMPPPEWLKAIRERIAQKPKEIKAILNTPSFKSYFRLEGDQLKTAPKGFAKDHPQVQLLRYKDFMAIHYFEDKIVIGEDFLNYAVKACRALQPFDEYLNRFT